jgi:hypothetical protein
MPYERVDEVLGVGKALGRMDGARAGRMAGVLGRVLQGRN